MAATHLRRILAACVALLLLCSPARAQDEPIDQAGPFALPYSGRSLAACIKSVGFDADQATAARALHSGYRAAFSAATHKAHTQSEDAAKKARENNDWAAYNKENGKITLAFVETSRTLEKGLLDDLKALCTTAQADRFASAERARRRETGLLLSFGAGERIDLVSMFDALKIDRHATPALDELVTHWETEVDRLLIEKEKVVREGLKEMSGGDDNGPRMEKAAKFFSDLTAISTRVGEANRRAAAEAEPLLPEAKRADFANEIKLRSFPRIYGPSTVATAIHAAQQIKGLSAEQKTELSELKDSYDREAAPINTRWASASEQKLRDLVTKPMEVMTAFDHDNGDPNDPFVAASKDRHALDDRYKAKISEILIPEQRDQLPKDPPKTHDIPEFLPDFETEFKSRWSDWNDESK